MHPTATVDRVILIIADGLRPDAIDEFGLSQIAALRSWGASTMQAVTVAPSRGWSALTSLMTGVSPDAHRVVAHHVRLAAPRIPLKPIPQLLGREGRPSWAFLGNVPPQHRLFATRLGKRLGFSAIDLTGGTAGDVVRAATRILRWQRRGLIVLRLRDADTTGHQHGWMSPPYAEAARKIDTAVGSAAMIAGVPLDPRSLLIVVAGHGGGGVDLKGHDSAHALDRTVPVIVAGGPVAVASKLPPSVSLLDVSATMLYSLGVPQPATYGGSELRTSFAGSAVTGRAA